MSNLSFTFLDICYADYLSDHHSRSNEQLICTDWYEGITHDDLVKNLIGNVMVCNNDAFLALIPDEDDKAVEMLTALIKPEVEHLNLEMENVDEPEYMMCYGYFSWEQVKTIKYTVPTWVLCPIFNGDESSLTDEEQAKLNNWLASLGHSNGHWSQSNTEEYFSYSNDIDSIGGNVCEIEWVVMGQ